MTLSEKFIMSMVKTEEIRKQETASMLIVIRQPYAYLQKEMEETFKNRENVRVLWTGVTGAEISGSYPSDKSGAKRIAGKNLEKW